MIPFVAKIFSKEVTFTKLKVLLTTAVLYVCFLLFLFFQSITYSASWLSWGGFFSSLFFTNIALFLLGIFLQTLQAEERTQGSVVSLFHAKRVWVKSVKKMIRSVHLVILPYLLFCVAWFCLGIFYLFQQVPIVNFFLNTFLLALPFLCIFSAFMLLFFQIFSLFWIVPNTDKDRKAMIYDSMQSLQKNMFVHLLTFFSAALPLAFYAGMISLIFQIMPKIYFISVIQQMVAVIFLSFPVIVIASFIIIFFFQVSYELNQSTNA